MNPRALEGGAGVNAGDWSLVFSQLGSADWQNNSLISNKFIVVNFCMTQVKEINFSTIIIEDTSLFLRTGNLNIAGA